MRTEQYIRRLHSKFAAHGDLPKNRPPSIAAAHPDQKFMGGRRLGGSGDSANDGKRGYYRVTKGRRRGYCFNKIIFGDLREEAEATFHGLIFPLAFHASA